MDDIYRPMLVVILIIWPLMVVCGTGVAIAYCWYYSKQPKEATEAEGRKGAIAQSRKKRKNR